LTTDRDGGSRVFDLGAVASDVAGEGKTIVAAARVLPGGHRAGKLKHAAFLGAMVVTIRERVFLGLRHAVSFEGHFAREEAVFTIL